MGRGWKRAGHPGTAPVPYPTDLSQNLKIGLPGGSVAATDRRTDRQFDRGVLRLFCVLSWRVFWMTMMNRAAPTAPPTVALTPLGAHVLDRLLCSQIKPHHQPRTLSEYLTKIARLGGYLARSKDPPAGNMVMWRGLSRLADIEIGFIVGVELVGN